MTLVFPSSPAVGDYYAPGSRVWRWTGTIWQIVQPVQFAKVGNYVETITPTPIGHQRLLNGAAPLVALLLGLSSLFAWGQAPTVSKVMVDVKMSDNSFEERQLTPVADNVIGFDGAGALVVKAGGGGIGGTLGTTNNALPRASGTGGSTLQGSLVTINDAGDLSSPKVTLGDNGSSYGRIGFWDAANSAFNYLTATSGGFEFGSGLTVKASSFEGQGQDITNLNAANINDGILSAARLPIVPVANGGTGATTLTANNVLLGNGASALQTVAPSTSGNVLTSNGTTWTSAAAVVRNPAGSGSELQFRSSGTAFGAVTNSSVSGGAITLGAAEALGTTSTARLTLANTTAATAGSRVQVSPTLVYEGRGWKTDATAASQTVQYHQFLKPVEGTASPSADLIFASSIAGAAAAEKMRLSSDGKLYFNGATTAQANISGVGTNELGLNYGTTRFLGIVGSGEVRICNNVPIGFSVNNSTADVFLHRDGAAGVLAQRNSTNAQTLRVYDTFGSASDYHRLGMATVRISQTATAGATITLTELIPDGAVVMGVTTKVTTALTGGVTGYQIGTAADADRWGVAATATIGTTTDNRDWTNGTIECFTAATDVILTANGASFSGTGVIYVSIQYMRGESD